MINLKVGLLFEGTYPYVVGGVSSWGHSLIKNMKDIEFCVIHVGDTPRERKQKYVFPENVTDYFEFYLFAKYKFKNKRKVTKKFTNSLGKIITYPFNENKMGKDLYDLFKKNLNFDFTSFLKSELYWSSILKFYEKYLPFENFPNYYWTLYSMMIPFLNSMAIDLPKCDIYHTITTGYAGISAILNGLKYNKPVILTEHGIYHRERQLEILRSDWIKEEFKTGWIKLFNTISSIVYKGAKKITTLFEDNQKFEKELCSEHSKMLVIPNGIDVERFKDIQYRKEKQPFTVGIVGRVVEIKDIKTAIKAARIVKDEIKSFKLYIIGPTDEEPNYFKECYEMVEIFNLKDTVEFTGMVDVKEYYDKLNILLISSVSEGQPLVILEALSIGIPVVATNVGACRELIYGSKEDIIGPAGIVVKPKDFKAMANAIITLYKDDSFRKRASEIGKKRVMLRYRLDQMVGNYKKLYYSVVE
ncbi:MULTISPECIES: GT4 family glycosyltransferase PelF [unclassified Thermosipho (in: thermotogales)]|uniref:GT4 family glycosyltransferase PelF n=1 Tax=unclassified Thermosipho (in: thermotogales) TaxID=2676525 RepID=UPI000984D5E2|nr:GT4 family glycosyltransferase PelF [Thermosipho sp. 1223]